MLRQGLVLELLGFSSVLFNLHLAQHAAEHMWNASQCLVERSAFVFPRVPS